MYRTIAAFLLSVTAAGAGMPTVTPLGPGSFAVHPEGGLSATEAFCAAGTYARGTLGLATSDRIWRTSPVPRPSGQPMTFSTSPEGAAPVTGLLLFGPDDGSVTVGFARALCAAVRDLD